MHSSPLATLGLFCWTCFSLSMYFVYCGAQTGYSTPEVFSQLLSRWNKHLLSPAGCAFAGAAHYAVGPHPHEDTLLTHAQLVYQHQISCSPDELEATWPSAAADALCSLTKSGFYGFPFPFHALDEIMHLLREERGREPRLILLLNCV